MIGNPSIETGAVNVGLPTYLGSRYLSINSASTEISWHWYIDQLPSTIREDAVTSDGYLTDDDV